MENLTRKPPPKRNDRSGLWEPASVFKPEGISPPPQVDSQGNPTVCDAEIFGGATAVRLLLEIRPREAVGQSLQI